MPTLIANPVAQSTIKVRRSNPALDPTRENVTRSDRPEEWTKVGITGQVYVDVGENVSPDDYVGADGNRSDTATNLRCMRITTPYDTATGYAVAVCLKL